MHVKMDLFNQLLKKKRKCSERVTRDAYSKGIDTEKERTRTNITRDRNTMMIAL
jgi:hypothetical protein